MRIAAIYDIHGNLPALQAVLAEIRRARIDLVVVGGDVLPGPMPRQTVDCLQNLDLPARFICGNGDRAVLEMERGIWAEKLPESVQQTIRWSARQLGDQHLQWLASWPPAFRVDVNDLGEILFCHATPRSDSEIFTRHTAEHKLLPVFQDVAARLVVCGHTHMQFDRMIGPVRVINAGSVGMPFGAAGAYWLLIAGQPQLRRTDYDRASAAQQIRASGYPEAAQFAEKNVLHPPSETEMLADFSAAELQ